jgi:beta-phosphoglucomutase-like phosphatase (HAD superfamily)
MIDIESILNIFPILQKAERLYYKELFTHKKPHPECYLRIASEFSNLSKIGFEDSLTGITALMQVPSITPVFINNSNYYNFDYIRKTYSGLKWIKSFSDIL